MVFEQQGGMSKAADAAIRGIAMAVSMAEGCDEHFIRREMLHRIAVIVARAIGSRIARRARQHCSNRPAWVAATSTFHLEVEDGE